MAACTDVRYDTAAAAYECLLQAEAGRKAPRLHPCGACRGWHLTPRRVTRAQWLSRRKEQDSPQVTAPTADHPVATEPGRLPTR